MKRLHTRLVLFLCAFLAGTGALAQRGREVDLPTPHEIVRDLEQQRQAQADFARIADIHRRDAQLYQARAKWRLQATKENFARVQAATILLDHARGPDSQKGPVQIFDAARPLSRSGDMFPHILRAVRPRNPAKSGVALLDFLPADAASFQRIFGRSWTAADQSHLQRAHALAREQDPDVASSFQRALAAPNTPIVVFIGHNDGGSLVTPEGSRVSLKAMNEACGRALKLCIFAVCDSQVELGNAGVGMSGKISLVSAGKLTRDIVEMSRRYQTDPAKLAPIFLLHDILERVDVNGNILRYAAYRTRGFMAVHMIIVTVRCESDDLC